MIILYTLSVIFLILGPIVVPLLLWRWKGKTALVYLGVYVVFYAFLSLRGQYVERIEAGADGTQTWYPLWCENTTPGPSGRIKTGPSDFGVYFWPLLFIDQNVIHRDLRSVRIGRANAGLRPQFTGKSLVVMCYWPRRR